MKLLLYEFGFGDIWINPYSVTPVRFITAFKQRLVDNFVQKWKSDLDANSVLVAYKYIKNEFLYEEYLDIVQNKNLRRYLTKLRLSSHNLKIETGRFCVTKTLRYITIILEECIIFVICYKQGRKAI